MASVPGVGYNDDEVAVMYKKSGSIVLKSEKFEAATTKQGWELLVQGEPIALDCLNRNDIVVAVLQKSRFRERKIKFSRMEFQTFCFTAKISAVASALVILEAPSLNVTPDTEWQPTK